MHSLPFIITILFSFFNQSFDDLNKFPCPNRKTPLSKTDPALPQLFSCNPENPSLPSLRSSQTHFYPIQINAPLKKKNNIPDFREPIPT